MHRVSQRRVNSTTRRQFLLTIIAGLFIAGCALDAAVAYPESDANNPSIFEHTPGPLDNFQLAFWGAALEPETQAELQARLRREHRDNEARVVACMAEQGFTYFPMPFPGFAFYAPGVPELGTREFAVGWGMGVSTDPWGHDTWFMRQDASDPNRELHATMSSAEFAAWELALMGDGSTVSRGCQTAREPGFNHAQALQQEFGALMAERSRLVDLQARDQRTLAINAEWESCMADHGFSGIRDPMSLINQVLFPQWNVIRNDAAWVAARTEWDCAANPAGPEVPAALHSQVAEFRALEIAMAVADFECQILVDFNRRHEAVRHDIERDFVKRNRYELELMLQWAQARTQSS